MATTHLLLDIPAVFLVYLAVDPSVRGAGVGGELFEFIHQLRVLPGSLGLVWEAERVADAEGEGDRRARQRRLRFFEAHGGAVVSEDYRQPALDGIAPVPMNILFRPHGLDLDCDAAFVRALVRSIYFEKYGALNGVSRLHLEDLLAGARRPRAPFLRDRAELMAAVQACAGMKRPTAPTWRR